MKPYEPSKSDIVVCEAWRAYVHDPVLLHTAPRNLFLDQAEGESFLREWQQKAEGQIGRSVAFEDVSLKAVNVIAKPMSLEEKRYWGYSEEAAADIILDVNVFWQENRGERYIGSGSGAGYYPRRVGVDNFRLCQVYLCDTEEGPRAYYPYSEYADNMGSAFTLEDHESIPEFESGDEETKFFENRFKAHDEFMGLLADIIADLKGEDSEIDSPDVSLERELARC